MEDTGKTIFCSFCGLHSHADNCECMIAGPGAYICNECVDLCSLIIQEQRAEATAKAKTVTLEDLYGQPRGEE